MTNFVFASAYFYFYYFTKRNVAIADGI